ncbi:unnamed protein product [Closterium sp. NIES-53]
MAAAVAASAVAAAAAVAAAPAVVATAVAATPVVAAAVVATAPAAVAAGSAAAPVAVSTAGPGALEALNVGAAATTSLVPAFVADSGATSPTAQLSFTLDSGASSCYYTPSFSRNLVGVSHLHDLGVVTTFPLDEPIASFTVGATGVPLATFHREPGSGLYSLHTGSHHTGSGQVRSGLPESLAPLPRSPAPPCTPCFEGPSPVRGPRQECYFLIVVDDYSRYTTVLPLQRKADVPTVLEPWLLARGDAHALCGLRLHSDRGGSPGVAADYRVWGSLAHVRAPGVNKLSPHTRACIFLGFPLDTSGWQFYDPFTCSETFSPPLFLTTEPPPIAPVAPPPSRPAPSGVSHVTPRSSPLQHPVLVVSGGAGGAAAEGVCTGAAGACGADLGGAEGVRVETTPEEDTTVSTQRPRPALPPGFPSVPKFPPRSPLRPVAAEPGGALVGGTGVPGGVIGRGSDSGGAGAGDMGTTTPTPRTVCFLTRVQRLDRLEREERERGVTTAAEGSVAAIPGEGRGGVLAVVAGAVATAAGEGRGVTTAAAGAVAATPRESRGVTNTAPGAAAAAAPPQQTSKEVEQQRLRDLPDPAPARLVCGPLPSPPVPPVESLASAPWTRRSPLGRAVSPEPDHADGPFHLVLRSRIPPPPVLPQPPESSLTVFHDPFSDYLRASRPVISCVQFTLVTHPTAPLSSVSALVTTVAGFASSHRLDYASHLVSGTVRFPSTRVVPVFPLAVLEDRQFELGFLAADVPHLCAMLLAPEAEEAEMASYRSTGTYVDAVPPPGTNVVSGMWLYKVKRPPGSPPVFKACYVARGFSQREGVDFFQTFAPTPKMTTLRVLLHIAAQRDYELHSLEFSTAFLQGSLLEQIWLRRLPGFTGSFPPGTQWQLRRPVYDLRQAPREWHDTLRTTLAALDFFPSSANPSLFVRRGSTPFFVLVYVDDLVFATPDQRALASMKKELQRRHTCTDLGELQCYLGLQITRDRAACTITLTQSHMVEQILTRFHFPFSKVQPTPLAVDHGLTTPPSDEPFESSGPYPGLVGCLMYLMTCTRPDLAYPLSVLARFVAPGRHRPSHWYTAKRVANYVASTSGMGLVLGGKQPVTLTGFSESSWADDAESLRSIQCFYFSLGTGAISWRLTWASSVSSSSCEAEVSGILLCEEPQLVGKAKHIQLRYFLLRELQQRGQALVRRVVSEANTADIFTKALPPSSHARAGGAGAGGPRTRWREQLLLQQLHKRAVRWGSPGGGAWCATTGGPCESTPAGSAAGRRGGFGGGQQWQQRPPETLSPQQLREWAVRVGSPGGGAWGTRTGGVEAPGGVEATGLSAGDSVSAGAEPEEALHTFTLDSGATRCFFRDSTTVTPLTIPVPVTLADPSGGPVSTSPRSLRNLVATSVLQDQWVTVTQPGGELVAICMDVRTGEQLTTFTRRPGSGLYTLTTESALVAESGQTLLWHHRLGHPSLPRLRGMHSRLLVSGLPRSLPPLPRSLAPPCLPCIEGRQRAAPHSSSFPLTTAPVQTVDCSGERYFLLFVDDYMCCTMAFPLHSKAEVRSVLIRWIRAFRLQLRARFRGWFYHPGSHRVLSSQDVTPYESVCFYRLHPHCSSPVPLPPLALVFDPPPSSQSRSLSPMGEGGAGGATAGGSAGGGAGGAGVGGAGAGGAGARLQETLSPERLREWAVRWGSPGGGAWRARGAGSGGAGPGGASAGVPGVGRAGGTGAGGTGATGGTGGAVAVGAAAGSPGSRRQESLSLERLREWAVRWGSPGAGAGRAGAAGSGGAAGGTGGTGAAGGTRGDGPGGTSAGVPGVSRAGGTGTEGRGATGGTSGAGTGGTTGGTGFNGASQKELLLPLQLRE